MAKVFKMKNKHAVREKGSVPFAVVEAYKSIRTNLVYTLLHTDKKSFVVSSPSQGEGKSTTSVNIAVAFSQLGEKVLLVDADLRVPNIHRKLKISNQQGLSSLLVGMSTFEESVNHISNGLDVLTSGAIPPNPSELLSSEKMEMFISAAEKIYDRVVIDTPPIGVVSDALAFASKTAGVVLVVRSKNTTHDEVDKMVSAIEFSGAKVLGAVINGISNSNRKDKNDKYGKYGK